MIAQRYSTNKRFWSPRLGVGWFVGIVAFAGCRSPAPAEPPDAAPQRPVRARPAAASDAAAAPAVPADAVGRAGPVIMTPPDVLRAVEQARVLQHWNTGSLPALEALASVTVRRRLLIRALEQGLVRAEAAARGLEPPAGEVDALLRAAAEGTPPRADALPDAGAPLPDAAVRAAQRLGTTPDVVRAVARDLVLARLLATALVDSVPEAVIEAAWRAERTRAAARLVSVPRVPTSREISAAERTREADITAWYQENLHRFRTPERAEVQRLFVAAPADDAAARAAARAKVLALRDRVATGEAFEAVARAGSEGPFAARGGAVGLVGRKRLPLAFDQPVGALGEPVDEPAGVALYRVVRRVPAVDRPLTDRRVHREAAAAILEAEDALPHARSVAERAQALLAEGPDAPALDALVKSERLVTGTTPPFARSAAPVVPTIGHAPALFEDLFARTPTAPVTDIHRVRQHYVVGRRTTFDAPAPDAWAEARADFVPTWRARQRGRAVEDWLQTTLKDAPSWVDVERLKAVELPGVGAATQR